MTLQRVQFTESSLCQWAGMGDYLLTSPDGAHVIDITYVGEPPHGDSYHKATIDGRSYPGYVWGCMFAFSPCSRYLAFSAMPTKFDRRTAIVDLISHSYFILPIYIYQLAIRWPSIVGEGELSEGARYSFSGTEQWLGY